MKTLRNSVNLIGRLGKDPEIKNLGNNRTVARFPLATDSYYRNQNGDSVKQTQWHNIVAWNNTAQLAEKLLAKGKQVAVHGMLENRSWEDDKGEKRFITEVVVDEIVVFSKE